MVPLIAGKVARTLFGTVFGCWQWRLLRSQLIYAAAEPRHIALGRISQKTPQTVPLLLCIDSLLRKRAYCAVATIGHTENTASSVVASVSVATESFWSPCCLATTACTRSPSPAFTVMLQCHSS